MDQLSAGLMQILVPAVTAAVGILLTWGLAELRKYIKQKTTSEAATQAFDTVSLVEEKIALKRMNVSTTQPPP